MKATKASVPEVLKHIDDYPDDAQVRLPVVMALFGCSASTVWRGVKSGHIPKPDKLTPRTTSWNLGRLRHARNQKRGV